MADIVVKHRTLGEGVVVSISDESVFVKFGNTQRQFALKGFSKFFSFEDEELKEIVERATTSKEESVIAPSPIPVTVSTPIAPTHSTFRTSSTVFTGSLISSRAQTIDIPTMEQFYEVIGYLANPKHVSSFEAEVPKDGRDQEFERVFPGQKYRPIELGETPSGMPNKLSTQYRINFSNTHNCPQILISNMGAGNGSCAGRINKSGFVYDLVRNYGFTFGTVQDYSKIRKIAESQGFLQEFEYGYSL